MISCIAPVCIVAVDRRTMCHIPDLLALPHHILRAFLYAYHGVSLPGDGKELMAKFTPVLHQALITAYRDTQSPLLSVFGLSVERRMVPYFLRGNRWIQKADVANILHRIFSHFALLYGRLILIDLAWCVLCKL